MATFEQIRAWRHKEDGDQVEYEVDQAEVLARRDNVADHPADVLAYALQILAVELEELRELHTEDY